jgi:uncharacterized membrane protein HdeD (DUF308 family)
MTAYRALDLFSRSQIVRGAGLALFAAAAISWPDEALPASMVAAGALVALTAAHDVYVGAAGRRHLRAWPVLTGHGAACLAFGLLTIGLPRVPQDAAMRLVATWMILYGMMTAALAFALWPMRRTRWMLLAVTLTVVPLGLLASRLVGLPEFVPLYLGAFFAALLGALHLTAGLWLRRIGLPYFAPTTQAGWAPPTDPARPS